MNTFRIERHELGRRLHYGKRRIHHFHFGLAAIAAGAVLIALDLEDFLEWALP